MRVDLDDADGAVLGNCAEDRERDRMIRRRSNRHGAGLVDLLVEASIMSIDFGEIERIDRRVADIGDIAKVIGRDAGSRMDAAE